MRHVGDVHAERPAVRHAGHRNRVVQVFGIGTVNGEDGQIAQVAAGFQFLGRHSAIALVGGAADGGWEFCRDSKSIQQRIGAYPRGIGVAVDAQRDGHDGLLVPGQLHPDFLPRRNGDCAAAQREGGEGPAVAEDAEALFVGIDAAGGAVAAGGGDADDGSGGAARVAPQRRDQHQVARQCAEGYGVFGVIIFAAVQWAHETKPPTEPYDFAGDQSGVGRADIVAGRGLRQFAARDQLGGQAVECGRLVGQSGCGKRRGTGEGARGLRRGAEKFLGESLVHGTAPFEDGKIGNKRVICVFQCGNNFDNNL